MGAAEKIIGKGKLKAAEITITEKENGWMLEWPEGEEFHTSAVEARNSLSTMAQILADAGTSVIFIVEWKPTTKIGRQVVEAIQGSE